MSQPNQENHPLTYDRGADLGHVLVHFAVQNQIIKRWLPLISGVLMVLGAITLTTNLVYRMLTAIQFHGRAVILGALPFPLAFYVLIFVGGITLISLARIHWSDSITMFETGFAQCSRNRIHIWPYEATQRFDSHVKQTIFGGSIVSTQVNVILEDNSRRWVIRNDYNRMDELIHLLRLNILPGLVERAHQRLADGETIRFHEDLQATQGGLTINGDLFPYDQIETEIHNQVIKLHQKEKPEVFVFKSKISNITNLDLLLDLLNIPPNPIY